MTTEQLLDTKTVTLDGSGAGTVRVSPRGRASQWIVTRMTTSSGSAAGLEFSVYLNLIDPSALVDFTPTGNGDVSDQNRITLASQDTLIGQYIGGTPGLTATWVIFGESSQ